MDCRKPSSGFIDNIHEDLVEPDGLKVFIIVVINIMQHHHNNHEDLIEPDGLKVFIIIN